MNPREASLLLALLASGCAAPTFRPLMAEPLTPTELAAARHDLTVGGQDLGDVKVWSHGAPTLPAPGARAERQLLIGLRVRNDAAEVMRLDLAATHLEVHAGGRTLEVDGPLEVRGDATVPAGETRRLELLYRLPDGLRVADVMGYELCWALDVGARRVTRETAFRRAWDTPRFGPYRPYLHRPYPGGPYYDDPWSDPWRGWSP